MYNKKLLEGSWVKCIRNGKIRYITQHIDKTTFADDGKISDNDPCYFCHYDQYEYITEFEVAKISPKYFYLIYFKKYEPLTDLEKGFFDNLEEYKDKNIIFSKQRRVDDPISKSIRLDSIYQHLVQGSKVAIIGDNSKYTDKIIDDLKFYYGIEVSNNDNILYLTPR